MSLIALMKLARGHCAWAVLTICGLSASACKDAPPTACRCQGGSRCDAGGVCRPTYTSDADCGNCGECRETGLCYRITPCRCTDAAECNDGNACNGEESCDGDLCAAGTPVSCPPTGETCFVAVCETVNEAAACVRQPSGICPCGNPSECDDHDPCNGAEDCVNSNCYPGEPFACPPATTPCRVNACVDNGGTPGCELRLAALDSACDDGVPCTEEGSCNNLGDCITALWMGMRTRA